MIKSVASSLKKGLDTFIWHMTVILPTLTKTERVNELIYMNLNTSDDDGTVGRQLADLRAAIRDVMTKSNDITRNIRAAEGSARDSYTDVQRAREAIDRAEKTLKVRKLLGTLIPWAKCLVGLFI